MEVIVLNSHLTGEDFPAGRTIQLGLTSGAQTHTVFGRNEPAMIHYHRSMQTALQQRTVHDAFFEDGMSVV
jgi:hypothetical protein